MGTSHVAQISLDSSKLLGFRLLAEADRTAALGAKLGDKRAILGAKIGTSKIGAKVGSTKPELEITA